MYFKTIYNSLIFCSLMLTIAIIPYDEAIQRLANNSLAISDIRNNRYELEEAKLYLREELRELIRISWDEANNQVLNDLITSKQNAIQEIERDLQIFDYKESQILIAQEIRLKQTIFTVQELYSAIYLMTKQLSLHETAKQSVLIEYSFGMASRMQKQDVKTVVSRTESELETLRSAYQRAMVSLNLLLGEPSMQYIIIEFSKYFLAIPEDLNEYIYNSVQNSPHVRILEIELKRAYELYDLTRQNNRERRLQGQNNNGNRNRNGNGELYDARNAFERAEIALRQAREEQEAALQQIFIELDLLARQFETQTSEYESALHQLQTVESLLRIGQVTRDEVNQAKFYISQAEHELNMTQLRMWKIR